MNRWAILMLLQGCASMPPAEVAYQSLHLVDTLQTVQIARSSCFHEDNAMSKPLIGQHPSVAGALAWGVGVALAHWGLTEWMERAEAPRWLQTTWQAVSIGNTLDTVKNNRDQGIGLTGSDC